MHRSALKASILLVVLIWAAGGVATAQTSFENLSAHDPRRTPAVEIFHQWKDSVVYLTGPLSSGAGPAIDEFFKVPHNREIISIGSGFVIHPAGYIIANAHGTERVITEHVTLGDGRTLPAELIGLVRNKDLGLLKIDAGVPLKAVQLAKGGDFLIGEPVVVIGNPVGLMHTCTQGIISAANRTTQSAGLPGVTLQGLIQSDAGINPGSSGGPWFNVLGQVIGVTTSIKAGSQNIGFAVPVSAVRQSLPDMLDVERRYGLVTGLALQVQAPCKVMAVATGSPAALVGIEPGDILARLDGKPIEDCCDLHLGLIDRKPGETLKIELWRKEQLFSTALTLGTRPKPDGAVILKQQYGLTAVPLDAEKAHATALRVQRGVVITAVTPGPPYDKLQTPPLPGDVLARINNIRPRDLDHVGLLLDRVKLGEPVHFVLLRMKDRVATRVDMVLTIGKK